MSGQYLSPPSDGTQILNEHKLEELYGTSYDQPKSYEDEGPHRYIQHWYLFNRKNPTQRMPLPSNKNQVITDLVLAGWIQPPHNNKSLSPIFVELDNICYYAVDRTREYRGYWIYTKRDNEVEDPPLYWLQEPCPSQQTVHASARVTLTVLSVLIERVFSDDATAKKRRAMTVDGVLSQIPLLEHATPIPNPTKNGTEDAVLAVRKIEKAILAKYKTLIRMQLENFPEFTSGRDKFMVSLKGLRIDKSLQESDILWWTQAVEQNLQQYPWGGTRRTNNETTTTDNANLVQEPDSPTFNATSSLSDCASDNHSTPPTKDDDEEKIIVQRSPKKPRETKTRPSPKESKEENKKRRRVAVDSERKVKKKVTKVPVESEKKEPKSKDDYSVEEMGNAAMFWGKYMETDAVNFRIPWENIVQTDFHVSPLRPKNDNIYTKLGSFKVNEHPLEYALFVSEVLRKSFAKNLEEAKHFFSAIHNAYIVVFVEFTAHAMEILGKNKKSLPENTTAFHLLVSIMNLITQCKVIRKYEVLVRRGLDWEDIIKKVRTIYSSLDGGGRLGAAIENAVAFVEQIKKREKRKSSKIDEESNVADAPSTECTKESNVAERLMKTKKMLLVSKIADARTKLNVIEKEPMSSSYSVSKDKEESANSTVTTSPNKDTLPGDREHPIVLDDTNDESFPVSQPPPSQKSKNSNQAPSTHFHRVRDKAKSVRFQLPVKEPLLTDTKVHASPWSRVNRQCETTSLKLPNKNEEMVIFCNNQTLVPFLPNNKLNENSCTSCSSNLGSSQEAVEIIKIMSVRWGDFGENNLSTAQIPDPPSKDDASSLFRCNHTSEEAASSSTHRGSTRAHVGMRDRSTSNNLDSAAISSSSNCRSSKILPSQEAFPGVKIKSICWADLGQTGSAIVQFSIPPSQEDASNLFRLKHRSDASTNVSIEATGALEKSLRHVQLIDGLPGNHGKMQESTVESSPWFSICGNDLETSRYQDPPTKVDASVLFNKQSNAENTNESVVLAKPKHSMNSSGRRSPSLTFSENTENNNVNVSVHQEDTRSSEYHPEDRRRGRGRDRTESSRSSSDSRTRNDFGFTRDEKSLHSSENTEREKACNSDTRHRSRSTSSHRDSESDRRHDREIAYTNRYYYHDYPGDTHGYNYHDYPSYGYRSAREDFQRGHHSAYGHEGRRYSDPSYSSERDYDYYERGPYGHVSARSDRPRSASSERRPSPVPFNTTTTTVGRGRKMTEPAWMTRQKQNESHGATTMEVDKENPTSGRDSPSSFADLANHAPPKPRSLLPQK